MGRSGVSGVSDPSLLDLAISTSSTVMGWVWNLATFCRLLCLLVLSGRLVGGGRQEDGGGGVEDGGLSVDTSDVGSGTAQFKAL